MRGHDVLARRVKCQEVVLAAPRIISSFDTCMHRTVLYPVVPIDRV